MWESDYAIRENVLVMWRTSSRWRRSALAISSSYYSTFDCEDILKWYHNIFDTLPSTEKFVENILNSDIIISDNVYKILIKNGSLITLKFIHDKYGKFPDKIDYFMCENGELEIVKWVASIKTLNFNSCMMGSISGNHIEILKWLREYSLSNNLDNDFINNDLWIILAVMKGKIEIVKYLHDQGCAINKDKIKNASYHNFEFDMLKYVSSMDIIFDDIFYIRASRENEMILSHFLL